MSTTSFPTPERPQSIVETLAAWQALTPERTALTILHDGEEVQSTTTYRELHSQALQAAWGLRRRCANGARVLLLLPTGVEFVCAFYGCLASGMVAVPASLPQQAKKLAQWKKLQAIVDSSGATLIVVPAKARETLAALKAREGLFADCEVDTYDGLLAAGEAAEGGTLPLPSSTDLAFLQYTSGSTGTPKGVMITHANILANQALIASLMGTSAHTRGLSWLPLHHDMGLSAVLQMGSIGCSITLMSPVDFIQQPLRWMRAISEHRITTSGGPNFAYQLAATALQSPDATGLDLSSWEVAFCGAEPINPNTVDAFLKAAIPHRFAAPAFFPCYGMAEATVMVSGAGKGSGVKLLAVSNSELSRGSVQRVPAGDADAKSLVSCGRTGADHDIRIVTADGALAAEHQVGEIWVRGPSVGVGYYGKLAATRETFDAMPRGDADAPFMRTGDLGALVEGELYVTGRLKDMLIIRGRNLYPQDVEDCVQDSAPGLRRGGGAAISVTVDNEEKLVIVQEVGRTQRRQMNLTEVLRGIVVAVGEDFGVTPHQVVLVEPATIEKTSSGKIPRALCRRTYLQGQLRSIASWTEGQHEAAAPAQALEQAHADGSALHAAALRREIENRITRVAAEFLKMDASRVPRTTPWAELGFDSINALQLGMKVQQAIGITLDATVLWDCANIEELAAHIAGMKGTAEAVALQGVVAKAPASATLPAPAPPHTGPLSEDTLMALSDAEAEALLLKELAR